MIVCENDTFFSDFRRVAEAEGELLLIDDEFEFMEVVEDAGDVGGLRILRKTRCTAATKGRGPAFFLVLERVMLCSCCEDWRASWLDSNIIRS